jgi:hypothetical protein
MGIEAILALVSLVIPPAFDFVKKKFLKPSQDTPEATMAALATTKPEVMGEYLKGQAGLLEAKTKYFNRDVCGVPTQWVINLRASIRPIGVIMAFIILSGMAYLAFNDYTFSAEMKSTVDGVRYACVVIMASWFGDRLSED